MFFRMEILRSFRSFNRLGSSANRCQVTARFSTHTQKTTIVVLRVSRKRQLSSFVLEGLTRSLYCMIKFTVDGAGFSIVIVYAFLQLEEVILPVL